MINSYTYQQTIKDNLEPQDHFLTLQSTKCYSNNDLKPNNIHYSKTISNILSNTTGLNSKLLIKTPF